MNFVQYTRSDIENICKREKQTGVELISCMLININGVINICSKPGFSINELPSYVSPVDLKYIDKDKGVSLVFGVPNRSIAIVCEDSGSGFHFYIMLFTAVLERLFYSGDINNIELVFMSSSGNRKKFVDKIKAVRKSNKYYGILAIFDFASDTTGLDDRSNTVLDVETQLFDLKICGGKFAIFAPFSFEYLLATYRVTFNDVAGVVSDSGINFLSDVLKTLQDEGFSVLGKRVDGRTDIIFGGKYDADLNYFKNMRNIDKVKEKAYLSCESKFELLFSGYLEDTCYKYSKESKPLKWLKNCCYIKNRVCNRTFISNILAGRALSWCNNYLGLELFRSLFYLLDITNISIMRGVSNCKYVTNNYIIERC